MPQLHETQDTFNVCRKRSAAGGQRQDGDSLLIDAPNSGLRDEMKSPDRLVADN
jgi:hypothetical protein